MLTHPCSRWNSPRAGLTYPCSKACALPPLRLVATRTRRPWTLEACACCLFVRVSSDLTVNFNDDLVQRCGMVSAKQEAITRWLYDQAFIECEHRQGHQRQIRLPRLEIGEWRVAAVVHDSRWSR